MELVLARDYQQFAEWCADERHCSPTDRSVRYINSPRGLYGWPRDASVVELAGWPAFRSAAEVGDILDGLAHHRALAAA